MPAMSAEHSISDIMRRVFQYASSIDSAAIRQDTSYAYTRFKLNVERKNPTLMLVPSVYAIAYCGEREYIGETYSRVVLRENGDYSSKPLLRTTTIPHRRSAMTILAKYLTPAIYNETIIDGNIISPFNWKNRHFYHYAIEQINGCAARVIFKPKRKNTQLVAGEASVDITSGRVMECDIRGEFDMISFKLNMQMGKSGYHSLAPQKCALSTRFCFIGNKVTANFLAYYNLPRMIQDSVGNENDFQKMCLVRPDTLTKDDIALYERMFTQQRQRDSIAAVKNAQPKKKDWAKIILWDMIGDNVLNQIKTNFGMNNQGHIRLDPVLNPLYMGYDHRRGFTYKTDIRISYQFTPNSEFSARMMAGYAFKMQQFYYRLPVYYFFNKRRNGFLKLEIGNGNHISHQSVKRSVERQYPDTTGLNLPNFDLLNEFKQTDVRLVYNNEISEKFGLQIGVLYQKRVAVNRKAFELLGRQWRYRSLAPLIQLQYRPWGWRGPIFTADYDRSIKRLFKSNTAYERYEFNAEYIYRIHKLKSIQMRFGTGFYTWKNDDAYFLNYENFQENNIPGGWNDDWSGHFELLRSETYNTSEYYIRSNVTYESPMLLLSWLPWIGRFMEMERVYASVLDVKNIHPYMEFGYGFTTRLFSCGVFVSNGKGNATFGCKFGFELFRHW